MFKVLMMILRDKVSREKERGGGIFWIVTHATIMKKREKRKNRCSMSQCGRFDLIVQVFSEVYIIKMKI